MQFVPDNHWAESLVKILSDVQGGDSQRQQELVAQLNRAREHPQYPYYLALILASNQCSVIVRQLAAIELKNNVLNGFASMDVNTRNFIVGQMLEVLVNPHLGGYVGIIIAAVATKDHMFGLQLMQHLLTRGLPADLTNPNNDPAVVLGALCALDNICKDYDMCAALCYDTDGDRNVTGQQFLSVLLPKLIEIRFIIHADISFRLLSSSVPSRFYFREHSFRRPLIFSQIALRASAGPTPPSVGHCMGYFARGVRVGGCFTTQSHCFLSTSEVSPFHSLLITLIKIPYLVSSPHLDYLTHLIRVIRVIRFIQLT
jgi:hypothetical protein